MMRWINTGGVHQKKKHNPIICKGGKRSQGKYKREREKTKKKRTKIFFMSDQYSLLLLFSPPTVWNPIKKILIKTQKSPMVRVSKGYK